MNINKINNSPINADVYSDAFPALILDALIIALLLQVFLIGI
jgi:hypothetical protein